MRGRIGLGARLALILAAGLLAAQAVSGVLLTRAESRLAEARAEAVAARVVLRAVEPGALQRRTFAQRRLRGRFLSTAPPPPGQARPAAAARLAEALDEAGIEAEETAARLVLKAGGAGSDKALALGVKTQSGWITARVPVPRGAAALLPIILQTLIIYAVLLIPLLVLARMVMRPLRRLGASMRRFPDAGPSLDPGAYGPADVAELAAAFEEMRGRIDALFTERDALLGAIAHDLKTPITSLRLRAEEIEDRALRAKMTASLGELSGRLDDALALARAGRPEEDKRKTELSALAREVLEGAAAAGQSAVAGRLEPCSAAIYPMAVRRALGNLLANADRHGGGGRLSVTRKGGEAWLAVQDDGPGLPAGRAEALKGAFIRGEASRSRKTGGAGLGLAIAERVARLHGGRLVLRDRASGGVLAALVLPALAEDDGQSPKKPFSSR